MNHPVYLMGKVSEISLYLLLERHILSTFPDVTIKHDRTQTAFVRRVQFAWISMPRKKADAGALMLSIGLPGPLHSPRIQNAAEVAPGRWMHHMLIHSENELDCEVFCWLASAWALTGCGRRGGT